MIYTRDQLVDNTGPWTVSDVSQGEDTKYIYASCAIPH